MVISLFSSVFLSSCIVYYSTKALVGGLKRQKTEGGGDPIGLRCGGRRNLVGIGLADDVLDGLVDCLEDQENNRSAFCVIASFTCRDWDWKRTAVDLVGILVGDLDAELLIRRKENTSAYHQLKRVTLKIWTRLRLLYRKTIRRAVGEDERKHDMTYLLNGHHNLHSIKGIETKVVGEVGCLCNLYFASKRTKVRYVSISSRNARSRAPPSGNKVANGIDKPLRGAREEGN